MYQPYQLCEDLMCGPGVISGPQCCSKEGPLHSTLPHKMTEWHHVTRLANHLSLCVWAFACSRRHIFCHKKELNSKKILKRKTKLEFTIQAYFIPTRRNMNQKMESPDSPMNRVMPKLEFLLTGNLGSCNSICKLILTQLEKYGWPN